MASECASTYENPILPGFFPDPSIVRVGEDYYLANSTFQYFPAVVLSHSRDLVHWEYIGHAVTRPEDLNLDAVGNSWGVWAPDISYHDGKFYVFFPFIRQEPESKKVVVQNMMVCSERPEGPYSKPVVLNEDGIDPSHFVDDDGTHYLVHNEGVKILKLTEGARAPVGESITLWPGTGRQYPEGPHIFRHDGYYYLVLAEGGTGWHHAITMARSRNLLGPYEESPYNPLLTQTDYDRPIQKTGHGKLVQTQHGDFWVVYLCGRLNDGRYCTLGRETCLDPVTKTDDGWFIVNGGRGPSDEQAVPSLPAHPLPWLASDEFDSPKLGLQWQFVRLPEEGSYSLGERASHLRLYGGDRDLSDLRPQTLLLQRERHHRFTATVKMEFYPERQGEQAGLVSYYDNTCYAKLCLISDDGPKVKLIEQRNGYPLILGSQSIDVRGPIYLREVVNRQEREFLVSEDGESFRRVAREIDARYLSDEGTKEMCFTGTMVGVYATNGGSGRRVQADFDWFRYMAG
jgi:xylan 1,4-beta-xylosidase